MNETTKRRHAVRGNAGDSTTKVGKAAQSSRANQASPELLGVPGEKVVQAAEYGRDLWQRSILFLDTLRERANNMLDHERAGLPPLLDFKYEMILDGRDFEAPSNYALLRITEVGDDCWDDCVDPEKPPVIVIDPRAGHGPGIGGFKHDSEVGMALHEGHPVYFVMFYPEPSPGQTLADVLHALRRFVDEVAQRHPKTPPIFIRGLRGLGRPGCA